jgi:type IV secretion system protein VirD4
LELVFLLASFVLVAFRRPKSQAYGSAGFTTPRKANRELRLLYPVKRPLPPGAFFLGQEGSHFIALPPEIARQHGLICGPSGCGKSRAFYFANARLANDTSIICTDPKSELWTHTSGFAARALRFAAMDPDKSQCFNWIPLCSDPQYAELCARAAIQATDTDPANRVWVEMEIAFLAALFSQGATLSEPTPLSVYNLFTLQDQETLLEQLLSSSSMVARRQANIFRQAPDRMKGSIITAVNAALRFLEDERVERFTSASVHAPHFGELRRAPYAVYWCLEESDLERLRPLTSIFFAVALLQIQSEKIPDGEPFVPILALFDEFANSLCLPNYDTTLTLLRGRGVGVWMCLQSLSQLEDRYGAAKARTILETCATQIAMSGVRGQTGKYFSEELGEKTETTKRRGLQLRWGSPLPTGATQNEAEHGRPLRTRDEVRRGEGDETTAIIGNLRPMKLPRFYYQEPPCEAKASSLGAARSVPVVLPEVDPIPALPELPKLLRIH